MSATGDFMKACKWRWFTAGGVEQVRLDNGEDIANLAFLDRKHFMAMSMPVSSVRLDRRMLEFMDSDGDGRIRISDVVAAVDFLKSKNVDLNSLFTPSKDDAASLEAVMAKRADLAAVPPSEGDVKALSEWAEKGCSPEIAVLGDSTAEAVGALAAVEKAVDAFFALTEDVPLVMEEPDKTLPLDNRINPVFRQAFADLREKCVKGVLGDVDSLDVLAWERLKEVFAPYRAHQASKPVVNAGLVAKLRAEGCIAVEMEVAGVQAVCDFYGLELYDFLEAGDVLESSGYEVEGLDAANHNLGKLYIALETALHL